MNIKKCLNSICLSIVFIVGILIIGISAQAGTVYDSPYVTFSSDEEAFTTNSQDKNWKWYDEGTRVTTDIPSSLRALEEGEHYYRKKRTGNIPIEKWKVVHKTGTCCHDGYPDKNKPYHDIEFRRKCCLSFYYSGWNAYCADCYEPISDLLIYMSEEAAQSITELDLSLEYYYTCPHCTNLEQGSPFPDHICKAISWNKYKVKYMANTEVFEGYMDLSIHMYNNATEDEGEPITPATRLTKNTFTATGLEFMGWNTIADGSGTFYSDNEEIDNLTDENYDGKGKGIITLYAQWKVSESTLNVNPNGGKYQNNSDTTSFKQKYRTTYTADPKDVIPPKGYTVSFVTDYNIKTPNIVQGMEFVEWKEDSSPFHGKLKNNIYTYLGKEKMEDTITAIYNYKSVTLPMPVGIEESNSSFGGWYKDPECTLPVGKVGDEITPTSDLILYAKSARLQLNSVNNMNPYGGSGAVDLSWAQNDKIEKTYLLYQSLDTNTWKRIYGASDMTETKNVNVTFEFNQSSNNEYTVPYSGFYTLTAYGAQGGNFGSIKGGKGGEVTGKVWLTKGDKVIYTLGGQNGHNGGGSGSRFANGGGMTNVTLITQNGTSVLLLIAGGGGGASSINNGGEGGSTTGLSSEYNGKDGAAGGGAGHQAGKSGLYHSHTNAGYLVNRDNSTFATVSGECYKTIASLTDACTTTVSFPYQTYYGWTGKCNSCGNTGDKTEMYRHGKLKITHSHCGANYEESWIVCGFCFNRTNGEKMPVAGTHDYQKIYYARNCGKENIETSGYGGSNYVNTDYFISNTPKSGIKEKDGSLIITSNETGFEEALNLNEVKATDLASPNIVGLPKDAKTDLGNNQVKIVWNASKDNGTVYYHKAESYNKKDGIIICESNNTKNELISGTKGYYYLVDTNAGTTVSTTKGTFTSNTFTTVTVKDYAQYLHICAVDVAGNISPTTHIEIGKNDSEIAWEIWTDKMQITSEHDSIYPANTADTYYVRADGVTPWQLSFSGYTNVALPTYQVNHTIFKSSVDGIVQEYGLRTKHHAITNNAIVTKAYDLDKYVSGTLIFQDAAYSITTRSEGGKKLAIEQKFLLPFDFHGKKITVIPVAGADFKEDVQYSDNSKDCLNGIQIIGDGIAPIFKNTEVLEALELIDRNAGGVVLEIGAEDDLSGIREFYIEIFNTDNVSRKRYDANASNVVAVDITEDEPIFSGDFMITLYAIDNVGNMREEVYSTTEFSLTSSVSRILEPHTPIFKCGESGILNIVTYGYADYIEIEFPKAMSDLNPDLNRTIYYTDIPQYFQEENIQFMIPLKTPYNTNFEITVKAYKGDKKLEDHPALSTIKVEETVTDEIRTRLR